MELAIPLLALGGMYVITNQSKTTSKTNKNNSNNNSSSNNSSNNNKNTNKNNNNKTRKRKGTFFTNIFKKSI